MPATTTAPAATGERSWGVSTRDDILIGASAEYPRGVQYASSLSNRVRAVSLVTHFVAET